MKKLIFLLILLCDPAYAITCPPPQQPDGYSGSLAGQVVTGYNYSTSLSFLYMYLSTGLYNGYLAVSPLTVNYLIASKTPDSFYSSQINGQRDINSGPYHETLMTELCGNLLTEGGNYILSK